MTVMLIAVAGLFLAGIARQSLLMAVKARESQENLQRRWGTFSCRQAILLRAEQVLRQQGFQNHTGPSVGVGSVSAQLVMGGMQFDVLLADESAKVNLNTIFRWQGKEDVSRLVRKKVHSYGTLPLRLCPYRNGSNTMGYPAFDSWGQVFALNCLENSIPIAETLAESTGELTCWGDGKLNLEYAPDEAVKCIGRLAVGDSTIRRLLDMRQRCLARMTIADRRKRWVTELFDGLSLRQGERQQLEQLMTDRSTCHSLWITIRTNERSWYNLCIADSAREMKSKCRSYCW